MSPTALITGISGQDGSYLAEQLLARGHHVVGLADTGAAPDDRVDMRHVDLRDTGAVDALLADVQPDEIYNLAARSSVAASFEQPLECCDVTGMGVVRLLSSMLRHVPGARLIHASSSEIFGQAARSPQNESTALAPVSPYGAAKVLAHTMVASMRHARGVFACNAILFNHESPRRGPHFVTRKVTRAAARISLGLERELHLGTLNSRRDWGYAPDYMRALQLMAAAPEATDFVVATGETHSIEDLVRVAFSHVGLEWREHVSIDSNLARPADVAEMRGDASKIRSQLGWAPSRDFAAIIGEMVDSDLAIARREQAAGAGRS